MSRLSESLGRAKGTAGVTGNAAMAGMAGERRDEGEKGNIVIVIGLWKASRTEEPPVSNLKLG
ncbi:hypothetical protein CBM2585_B20272 [Cupriavidus taiwanensis]|nr:hypothetical protein CBM2585_B20272 [Cupriavidus taiwanensis]